MKRGEYGGGVRTGAASERARSIPQPRWRAAAPYPLPRSSLPSRTRFAGLRLGDAGVVDCSWFFLLRTAIIVSVQNPPHFFPPCRKETRWSRKERGALVKGLPPLNNPRGRDIRQRIMPRCKSHRLGAGESVQCEIPCKRLKLQLKRAVCFYALGKYLAFPSQDTYQAASYAPRSTAAHLRRSYRSLHT